MDRRSEAGQLVIETAILSLLFIALFFLGIVICQDGEKARSHYRFESRKEWR